MTARPDVRTRILIALLFGLLVLTYGFMQVRIPPTASGIPVVEIYLLFVLFTTNLPAVLSRMGAVVSLAPFVIWWCFSLARAVGGSVEYGLWAMRDASQEIESLYVIVGFTVAAKPENVNALFRWLQITFVVFCIYAPGFMFQSALASISPTFVGASIGQAVPLLGMYGNIGPMLLWIAFYFMSFGQDNAIMRKLSGIFALLVIAFLLVVVQARESYLQILALMTVVLIFRRDTVRKMAVAVPVLFIVIGIVTALDIRISGRITSEISFSFFWDHFAAIFGEGSEAGGGGDAGAISAAAGGVSQRLTWWKDIYERLTSDGVSFLTGLGYGMPLTNFVYTGGLPVREPHNSFMSVLGRLGVFGAVLWIWMQVELMKALSRGIRYCRRSGWRECEDRLLLILVFAVLALVGSIGEDSMEKPYMAVPYYCLLGVALRIRYDQIAASHSYPRGSTWPAPA